jgi:hypothetical protein
MKQIVVFKYTLRLLMCSALSLTGLGFAHSPQAGIQSAVLHHELNLENGASDCAVCKKPQCNKEGICEVLCQVFKQGNHLEEHIEQVKKQIGKLDFLVKDEFAAAFKILCSIESQQEVIIEEIEACCSSFISKLDRCCATINSKVDSLTNTVVNDFTGTFTVLDSADSRLDFCCQTIVSGVNNLTNIVNVGFDDNFMQLNMVLAQGATTNSKIDVCCSTLISQNDSLAALVSADFAGTFTAIAAINCSGGSCDLSGTYTALDACCSTLNSKIDVLLTSTSFGPGTTNLCAYTPITGETTITSAGVYCLANDITVLSASGLSIAASNVVLDLNNHLVKAEGLPGFQFSAISIGFGLNNVVVKNGSIEGNPDNPVIGVDLIVGGLNRDITIENVRISNCNFGISANIVSNLLIKNVNVEMGSIVSGAGIAVASINGQSIGCIIEDCQVTSPVDSNTGYSLAGTQLELINCVGHNARFVLGIGSNMTLRSCIAEACALPGFELAFVSNALLIDCVSVGNRSGLGTGFYFRDSVVSSVLQGCSAIGCGAVGFELAGLSSNCTIKQCIAENNGAALASAGFRLSTLTTNCFITECQALGNNDNGFDISNTGPNCVVAQCTAIANSNTGFLGNLISNPVFYLNNSINNGLANYSPTPPSGNSAPVSFLGGVRQYGDNLRSL